MEYKKSKKIKGPSMNGRVLTSLILGTSGLIAWFVPLIGAPITTAGLIFGIKGLKSSKRRSAIVGIVLSSIGLFATIVNGSIGAYQGATGQNWFVNKFQNYEMQNVETRPTQQPMTAQNEIPDILEKKPYSNVQFGFEINAPKGWQVKESELFGTLVVFSNPETEQDGNNFFNANINVISESTKGLNFDEYIKASKEFVLNLLQNYELMEEKKVSAKDVDIKIIGGTFTQGVYQLRNLQLIAVKNDQAYVVTGTVLNSTWEKYKNLIEESLLTFKIY